MQQRKAAEAVLASDAKLETMASDIDTYFHLSEEENDTAQRGYRTDAQFTGTKS